MGSAKPRHSHNSALLTHTHPIGAVHTCTYRLEGSWCMLRVSYQS